MSKPLGLTVGLRVVIPSRAQDKIYEAVQEAIAESVDVASFIREARECWALVLKDAAKHADEQFAASERAR